MLLSIFCSSYMFSFSFLCQRLSRPHSVVSSLSWLTTEQGSFLNKSLFSCLLRWALLHCDTDHPSSASLQCLSCCRHTRISAVFPPRSTSLYIPIYFWGGGYALIHAASVSAAAHFIVYSLLPWCFDTKVLAAWWKMVIYPFIRLLLITTGSWLGLLGVLEPILGGIKWGAMDRLLTAL